MPSVPDELWLTKMFPGSSLQEVEACKVESGENSSGGVPNPWGIDLDLESRSRV